VEMTEAKLNEALQRHADGRGVVPTDIVERLRREGPWDGRRWDVLQVVGDDGARLAYLAGGLLAAEVATCVELWSTSALTVDQIRAVVGAGGYDPDPFGVIAAEGLLDQVLAGDGGRPGHIGDELAGAWISDQLAASSDEEVRSWAVANAR